MPFINDPYSLLLEASKQDLNRNTVNALTEGAIKTRLNSFEESANEVVITAEMVSVLKVNDQYVTEMNFLHPYMKSNGIKSVEEALDNVAFVNGLQEHSVGLLIESDDYIDAMLEKACKTASKKKDASIKDKALNKIKKATDLPEKLKKDGFPVIKKKSAKKEGCASKEGCVSKEGCASKEGCVSKEACSKKEGCAKEGCSQKEGCSKE